MDFKRFEALRERYQGVTVFKEIFCDLAVVPIILRSFYSGSFFLLESANTRKEFSRFTYFGVPKRVEVLEEDPFRRLSGLATGYAPVEEIGDFAGGYVFLLGYGASNYTGVLRRNVREGKDLAVVMSVDEFFVLDNYTQKVYGCVVQPKKDSAKADYEEALERLFRLEGFLKSSLRESGGNGSKHVVEDVRWEFEDGEFEDAVSYVKGLIEDGEAIQVVVSQKVEAFGRLNPLNFYRYLRKLNPSPYMFFLKVKDEVFCGSSPEVHLKVMGDKALMKPIAGTYPVGENLNEIIGALKSDEKERAEHLMLVDLARNDLYTHCEPASVDVPKFMEAEVYSHVVHLVSTIVGRLKKGITPVELLKMTFPAGTVSGAPKVRAMEIIDEVERSSRDFYAGCVGYYSVNGNMDTCITIRSAKFEKDRCILRAGAGIVYDSVPERERKEVENKLRALLVSLEKSPTMEV